MKEVIILGTGPSHNKCPYDAEVWACFAAQFIYQPLPKRIDKLFTVHNWAEYGPVNQKALHDNQKRFGFELVASTPHSDMPTTVYPIEEVLKEFKTRYFADLVTYMVPLAILWGYEKIRFYGIDCLLHSYYVTEKSCLEFWCGVAKGRGIDVGLTPLSQICKLPGEASWPVLSLPDKAQNFEHLHQTYIYQ